MPTNRPKADAEELAARLQSSLRRRRIKPTLIVLATLGLSVAALGILAWSLYPGPELPPLQVLALDGIYNPEEAPQARARLLTAGEGEGEPRERQEVFFLDDRAIPANAVPNKVVNLCWTRPRTAFQWNIINPIPLSRKNAAR